MYCSSAPILQQPHMLCVSKLMNTRLIILQTHFLIGVNIYKRKKKKSTDDSDVVSDAELSLLSKEFYL